MRNLDGGQIVAISTIVIIGLIAIFGIVFSSCVKKQSYCFDSSYTKFVKVNTSCDSCTEYRPEKVKRIRCW